MNRCENCKHWGTGGGMAHPDTHKRCVRLEEEVDQDAGGSPSSSLATPATFGCVLFEAKGGYEPEPED